MISFRFHLVSLVAVFMALGLGLLTGTTVLNRAVVRRLEVQTEQLADTASSLRERVSALEEQSDELTAFGEQTMGYLVEGRLAGADVMVLTEEGTDAETLSAVRRALDASEARVPATLSVSARAALRTDVDRRALADLVGGSASEPVRDLQARAADTLAERLATGSSGQDVLELMLREGFLVSRGPDLDREALASLGGPGTAVVVVAGGEADQPVEPHSLLVPLVRHLARAGGTVAAAEGRTSEVPFVTLLRDGGLASRRIVTQDNADGIPGEVGLVMALRDLLVRGRAGHYGVKSGASRLIPSP